MKNRKMLLKVLLTMVLILSLVVPVTAVGAPAAVHLPIDRPVSYSAADSSSLFPAMALNAPESTKVIPMVAAGSEHTVGLKSDGTVVAAGWNGLGECEVGGQDGDVSYSDDGGETFAALEDEDCYAEKAPELIAPPDGYIIPADPCGECGNVPFTIAWDRLCDASRYDIQFALDEDFDSIVEGASETDYLPPETETPGYFVPAGTLSCETVYYWTVRAVEAGTGQVIQSWWSDPRQLIVGVGSGRDVYLVAPEYGAIDVPITNVAFAWHSEATVEEYDWVLSQHADFSVPIKVATGLTAKEYTFTGTLEYDTTYSWQVSAFWDGAVVSISAVGTFRTMAEGLCRLTVSSTAGGSVTTPGEEIYTYELGEVINLVAEPEDGYRFVRWTGDVSTVGNVNAASTNITMQDNFLITANFAIPPIQYNLSIASTAGGSVTTPGEGTSSYDEGTVVNLVAEPEEGYRFVGWIGDVDAIANIDAASTTISTDGDYSIKANFVDVNIGDAGIKEGDWIKFEYTITGWPAGQPHPERLKLEFLSIEGTADSVKVTMGMSDGTEQSDTVPVDVGEGGGDAFGLSGFVIPPNLGRGDSVYFSGYGDVTIKGETTRTYAGVRRRVVYASFSQAVPPQSEVQLRYYWDKETGVMVEASTTWEDVTATAKATETNMLDADSPAVGLEWWLWVIIAVAISGVAFAVYRLMNRKTSTSPIPPPEGS